MAFNRIIEMLVGNNTGINLKVSDLNMTFDINRSFKFEENTAKFKIYNAKEDTWSKFLTKGNNIIFKAGYEDEGNIATIFSGIITESKSVKESVDGVTEIEAVDFANNSQNILKDTISLSYTKNTPMASVINDIRAVLDIPIAGIENVAFKMNGGFVYAGDLRGAISEIKDVLKTNGLGLYFDNNEMVVYVQGQQNSRFGVVRVTANSGLVGSVEVIQDEKEGDGKKRVSFSSLLNPKIKPNTLLQLIAENINGLFITEKVNHVGDNFGGAFLSKCKGVE